MESGKEAASGDLDEAAQFYKSKRGVKEMVDGGVDRVPAVFVQPQHRRSEASLPSSDQQIPVVDLEGLLGHRRHHILQQIAHACETWGFFQVVYHGIPLSLLERMIEAVHIFHHKPVEEKMKYYSEDLSMPIIYEPSSHIRRPATVHWRENLRLTFTQSLSLDSNHLPAGCSDAILEYHTHVKILGATLLSILAEILSVPPSHMIEKKCFMERQVLGLSYYPPCPQPDLALGLASHSDPVCITILLQDQVGGLQVFNEGKWVEVCAVPGALVVNVGDLVEILSNGRFKSVEHRVVTNSQKARVSIPCFFVPLISSEEKMGPFPQLLGDSNPPVYGEISYKDYQQYFISSNVEGKSSLELVKLKRS
eukprot:Gb_16438 [translate_table: standard]